MIQNNGLKKPIYPCNFPIKVIGNNIEILEDIVIHVMYTFGENIKREDITANYSTKDKYKSITFTIIAKNREYIDQIYAKLNEQKEILMVL